MIEDVPRSNYRTLIIAAAIFLFIALGTIVYLTSRGDSKTYKAVFLTNGQVYFGKISRRGLRTLNLNSVYYLQVKNTPTNTSTADDVSLIKLGNELHGPEDGLEVNWEHVLFVEVLRSDSRVVRAIENYRR
jgi:hypothetical protein